ncbi:MAG: DNA mismatch repair protein, partial [candidate division Zixibacteria bacterium]|nr:DNA mismatch repair protein [candidate division Zixibacteria bacterium]
DASFNFSSYADCFISENLMRQYIRELGIPIPKKINDDVVQEMRKRESASKTKGNISIDIRKQGDDLSYLDIGNLAFVIDPNKKGKPSVGLMTDAKPYKPIRDALMHTARLTDIAKQKLNSVYENIKGRVINLLS